ncbi:hypothetical protein CVT26_007473 [Gymnopilus dilepis]|uniref:Uncharacterized protein n=1 Tax=Gymnopilus dilepis TaxID=231916 RepID=A0A409W8C4_9AGAR|nr:hypothetical protein CVT26_007473 [Gymnopilus dilepis]
MAWYKISEPRVNAGAWLFSGDSGATYDTALRGINAHGMFFEVKTSFATSTEAVDNCFGSLPSALRLCTQSCSEFSTEGATIFLWLLAFSREKDHKLHDIVFQA